MAIERFSLEEFENTLPAGHWEHTGLIQGEHTYSIKITNDIFITIRSSVDSSGYSADTGEDSIRCYLIGSDGKPLGSKTQAYITRVKGWQNRLLDTLRLLWSLAQQSGYCETCKKPNYVFKSKKKDSKGRYFSKCTECNNNFKWLEVK